MNTEKFSYDNVKQLCADDVDDKGKPRKKMTPLCIAYMEQYFYACNTGTHYFWDALEKTFVNYTKDQLKDVFLNKLPDAVKGWYLFQNTKIYKVVNEVQKPRVYDDKINMFYGFKYPDIKSYTEYSLETKSKVDIFLSYIKEVLCSGNDEEYKYVLKWVANMCKGNKNDSCLYLKGPEGIGKSTFSDFLMKWVLGEEICTPGPVDALKSSYNKILCGKLFVVFEELPTFSDKEWEGISSTIKNMITENTKIYGDKYEKSFKAENINNYIINTNVEALKNSEGRRYFIMNVSTKRRQDHKYFGHIKANCFNKEVGEAFFALMRDTNIDGFNAQKDMPITDNKLNAIAERLCPEYKFIKEEYIFNKKDIKGLARDLYNEYTNYCTSHQYKSLQYTKFTTKLKEVNIEFKKSNGVYKYKVEYKELKAIADKYHWIHQLDEFEEAEIIEENETEDKDEIINKQKKQIEQLLAEVARLKAKLEDPLEDGINKEDQQIIIKPKVKSQPKKTVIIGSKDEIDYDSDVEDIILTFDD